MSRPHRIYIAEPQTILRAITATKLHVAAANHCIEHAEAAENKFAARRHQASLAEHRKTLSRLQGLLQMTKRKRA